jgi:Saccharopine dehydrogenase NADP binding domain
MADSRSMRAAVIAVVGGTGFYGQYLVHDLLAHTAASVVVINRRGHRLPSWGGRVAVRTADLFDRAALRAALRDVDAVAHVAGPFEVMPLGPLEVALELGLPYVDVSENRRWAAAARSLIERARPRSPVFTGASVTPALTTMVVAWIAGRLDTVARVRTIAAPDTRRHRGNGMFRTMLYGAGRPFQQPRDDALVTVHGWTEPEWYRFPDPIGPRLVHLVFGMAELDEIPARFGAGTVEFKAGSEMAWLNRLLATAARVRARVPAIALERLLAPVRALSWIIGRFGIDAGAVVVDVEGRRGGRVHGEQVAVVGDRDGGRIPIALAGVFLQHLVADDALPRGLVDPATWTTVEQLGVDFGARGLRLLHRVDGGAWTPVGAPGRSGVVG